MKKKKKSLKNAVLPQKLTGSEGKGKKLTKMEVIISNLNKGITVQDKYSIGIRVLKMEEMSLIKLKIV